MLVVAVEIWMARGCNMTPKEIKSEDDHSSESREFNNTFPNNQTQQPLLGNGDLFSRYQFSENSEWKKSIQYTEIPAEITANGLKSSFYSDHFNIKNRGNLLRNNHYQLQPFYSLGNSSLPAVNLNSELIHNRWNYGQIFESMDLTSNDNTPITTRANKVLPKQNIFERNGIDLSLRQNYSLPLYTAPIQKPNSSVPIENSVKMRSRAISSANSGPKLVFYNR